MQKNSRLQKLWDAVGIPFRLVLFDQAWLPRFGWTTLEDERLDAVIPHVEGRLLDIGAGPNTLVRRYGNGDGVDIFDWGNGVKVVENTSDLPYEDESFDTVTLVACLNHIPYREAVLVEANRVLKPVGKLSLTIINPILGEIGHVIWWSDEPHAGGVMLEDEVGGMWYLEIVELAGRAGFSLVHHERFVYKLNNLLVFRKAATASS